MSNKVAYECPRCCGKGNIQAFSGIMGGVCFKCNGSVKCYGKPSKRQLPIVSDAAKRSYNTIKTGDLESMSYRQLLSLRNDAHWNYDGTEIEDILKVWKERGEVHFQDAQEVYRSEVLDHMGLNK